MDAILPSRAKYSSRCLKLHGLCFELFQVSVLLAVALDSGQGCRAHGGFILGAARAAPRTTPSHDLAHVAASDTLFCATGVNLALSADRGTAAWLGQRRGRRLLFWRHLDDLESRAIPDSLGGSDPFFSPDGRWLAFEARGLQKVYLQGGTQ
jgi:WD40-like Beta Propeller Repeat